MHGSVPAVAALQRSDLLIAIGTRFDDRVTGKVDSFAPNAKVIHADIDPAEIGKIREAHVPIVGDAKEVLAALHKTMGSLGIDQPDTANWLDYLGKLTQDFPRGYQEMPNDKLAPQYVIETLSKEVGPDAIYCAGVGSTRCGLHSSWTLKSHGPG